MPSTEDSAGPESEIARLRAMLAHAEEVREIEKLQLARELHNDFGSALPALAMRLAILSRQGADAPGAADQWAKASAILATLTQTARRLQSDQRPGTLDVVGLKLALEEYLTDFSERHAIGASLNLPEQELPLPQEQAIALFRMFQQLLTNVRLHANAQQVEAALLLNPDRQSLTLSVADNGVGFDAADYDLGRSHGLRLIAERAAFFGGRMQIDSAAGRGTRVSVVLPLAAASAGTDFNEPITP
jgi:signal transduction histidine kinase